MVVSYLYHALVYVIYIIIMLVFGFGIGLKFFRLNDIGANPAHQQIDFSPWIS